MEKINYLENPLTEDYKNLKNFITGPEIAWYWKPNCIQGMDPKVEFLSHSVLERSSFPDSLYPKSYSDTIKLCEIVLRQIFLHNNISFNSILRINYNLTLRVNKKIAIPSHRDHYHDHTNLIIYLNDSDGDTILCDNHGNTLDCSEPKEDKIITFSGDHYHILPIKNSRRVVIVCTYF